MEPENKKSDAEEILSEFQKTHGTEPAEGIKHMLSLSWVENQLCHMLLQL